MNLSKRIRQLETTRTQMRPPDLLIHFEGDAEPAIVFRWDEAGARFIRHECGEAGRVNQNHDAVMTSS